MTPQYEGLQALHKKYADKGLVLIGFPCNQFGGQEPGSDEDIKEFCSTTYGVDFLMSTKIDVNGPDAHPLFKYLVSQADFDEVPWNFTKFLIDDQFRSMGPQTTPEQIDGFIENILS
jgi:glutathione peroxidase